MGLLVFEVKLTNIRLMARRIEIKIIIVVVLHIIFKRIALRGY